MTCNTMVEGNIVSFACTLERGHEGPHAAVENDRSMRERRKWEAEQRHEDSGLGQFQGRAQTTAERYTENPTPVPGTDGDDLVSMSRDELVQRLAEAERQGRMVAGDEMMSSDAAEFAKEASNIRRTLNERDEAPDPAPQVRTHYVGDACEGGHHDEVKVGSGKEEVVVLQQRTDGSLLFRPASSAEAKVAFRSVAEVAQCPSCERGEHGDCIVFINEGAVDILEFDSHANCSCYDQNPEWHEDTRLGVAPEQQAEPTKQREGDQPLPTSNDSEPVQDRIVAKLHSLVQQGALDWAVAGPLIEQMEESKRVGMQRYGTPLQTFNGRDTLQDAIEEARDLYVYLNSLQQAREVDRGYLVNVVTQAFDAEEVDVHDRFGDVVRDGERRLAEVAVDTIFKATGGIGDPSP